jgi:hypothetical protein
MCVELLPFYATRTYFDSQSFQLINFIKMYVTVNYLLWKWIQCNIISEINETHEDSTVIYNAISNRYYHFSKLERLIWQY